MAEALIAELLTISGNAGNGLDGDERDALAEAAQALRLLGGAEKALEEIADGAGMCSECGQHCGGCLKCNCRHASWIPLDPKVEARSALDKIRKGMGR